MALTQAKLDEKTNRRKTELARSKHCKVLEAHIDPETGAGVLIAEASYTFRKGEPPEVKAHFYRGPQLRRGFKEETITSNHQRIAVMGRLAELIAAEKAAKVAPHDLRPGEIIANIWGYSMQDVRFYIVTSVPHPRSVRVVQIPDQIVKGDVGSGQKMPIVPDKIPDPSEGFTLGVSMETGSPYLKTGSSIDRATRWNGKPVNVYSD